MNTRDTRKVGRREGRRAMRSVRSIALLGRLVTGDEPTRRFPCGWCDEPDRWPDACTDAPGRGADRCSVLIEMQCSLGDHRRCGSLSCVVAERWHEPVRRAGMKAARAVGAVWAVVSTIENRVDLVGTENDLGRAMAVLRNGALNRAGAPLGPEGKGLVYVVRGSDGGLF